MSLGNALFSLKPDRPKYEKKKFCGAREIKLKEEEENEAGRKSILFAIQSEIFSFLPVSVCCPVS